MPARRKFLRTEATEYAHIEQQFRTHAIANPRVNFTLIRDGGVAFHLPGTEDTLDRIRGLAGDDLANRLIKVERTESQGVSVWGYIGGPGLSRSSRQQQLTFLNGRPIESQVGKSVTASKVPMVIAKKRTINDCAENVDSNSVSCEIFSAIV